MTTLIDQLYSSGKAGEIEMIHDKITTLCTEVAAMKKEQDERQARPVSLAAADETSQSAFIQ